MVKQTRDSLEYTLTSAKVGVLSREEVEKWAGLLNEKDINKDSSYDSETGDEISVEEDTKVTFVDGGKVHLSIHVEAEAKSADEQDLIDPEG